MSRDDHRALTPSDHRKSRGCYPTAHPGTPLGPVRRAAAHPRQPHPLDCHRPRIPDRIVFDKLIQVLVFGCGYRRIADATCSATTLRRRRDQWIAAGTAEHLRLAALAAYDRMCGLELDQLAVDGCITTPSACWPPPPAPSACSTSPQATPACSPGSGSWPRTPPCTATSPPPSTSPWAPNSTAASTSHWPAPAWNGWRSRSTVASASCRAGSAPRSPWRWPWPNDPSCCCWTSRWRPWTRWPGASFSRRSWAASPSRG
jgi:hypothetical protein